MSALAQLARPVRVFLGIGCLLSVGHAQTTGHVAGTVRDVQGAVILHAEVSAQNAETGERHTVTTDESGSYVLTFLQPGTYQITFSAPGFAPARFTNVPTGAGETASINAVLRVAGATNEVTVEDAPPLVQSSSAEIGLNIDTPTLTSTPLPTRNFLQLVALSPGVTAPLTNNSAIGRNTPNFSVNGARTSQNNLRINGVDANDISAHDLAAVAIPAPESIGEFVVQTSMYDATVGGAAGTVQAVTKSGSNAVHGGFYEYFRNTALNANDPNLKAVGLGPPVLRRNVYGATLGGPLRKDKAFYFLSYQGVREANGATNQSLYKDVLIANGLTDDRSAQTLTTTFGGPIDPTALALLNVKLPGGQFLIPTPQQDGRVTGTAVSTYREEQFNINFDYHFGLKDSTAAKFFYADAPQFFALGGATFSGGTSLPGFGTNSIVNNRILSLQEIHMFSPTTVNEARFGYNFIRNNEVPQESVLDSDLGINRPTAESFPGLPLILLARDSGGAAIGSSPITVRGSSPSLTLVDVLSLQRRRHRIRVGAEFHQYRWDAVANVNSYGEIDFSTFDKFLTGASDFSSIGTGLDRRDFRASDCYFFAQDDWKVSRNLTINLGLRYELDLPPYDTEGRIGGFDPSLYQPRMEVDANGPVGPPVGGIVMAGNALPQYHLPGVPLIGKRILKSIDPNNVGPRVGLAWSPLNSDRLVLRGGYGIFYSRPSFIYLGLNYFAPPFYATSLSFGQTLENPFPNAIPPDQFPLVESGISLTGSIMDRNNRTPYIQQFNAAVESALTRNSVLQVAYVGTHSLRLFRQLAVNQARIASTNHPIVNAVTGESITTNTDDNAALRAPFQGVETSAFSLNQTSGQSNYNSMQAALNHRMSHGFDFQVSYTFSKSIDDASNAGGGAFSDGSIDTTSGLDTGSLWGNQFAGRANRGISDFDRTHRLVLNGVWELPNSKFANNSAARTLLSRWQVSGFVVAMSGLPVDIFDPAAGSLYGQAGGRPNWAPGAVRKTATRNIPLGYYFNPFAFSLSTVQPGQPIPSAHDPTAIAPAGGTDFGNIGRNVLRGPLQSNSDFSVGKCFVINEAKAFLFRADFFNAFNHASRSNPIGDISVAEQVDAGGRILSPGDFGRVLGFDSSPRIVQLSLSFSF
jgi:Carboxypeptidase regulatory-like domain